MIRKQSTRAFTLTEILIATALSTLILGMAIPVFMAGSQSFSREQGQSYTQFRVRTSLDTMANDIRSADAILSSAALPTNDSAITLEVPCQSTTGIVYSGTTMLKDTISYWHTTDKALHCTITKGDSTSKRVAGTTTIAQNFSALTFTMRDKSGAVTVDITKAAAIDVSATVSSTVGSNPFTIALTSVRMRNMRT